MRYPHTFCRAIIGVISIRQVSRKRTSNNKQSHIFATMKKKPKNGRRQCGPKKYSTSKKSDLDLIILNHVVMELERDKANNNGKLGYGAISAIVARMKPTAPFLTKDMVKYHLRKLSKTAEKQRGGTTYAETELLYPSSSITTASATISTLTNDHEDEMENIRVEPSTTGGNNAPVSDGRTTASLLQANNTTGARTCEDGVDGVVTQHVSEEDASHRNDVVGVFGRPKGSTQAHSRELKERLRLATAWAAGEYNVVRKIAKASNKRAKRGQLKKIIALAKVKYGLPDDVKISPFTVRARVKRSRTNPLVPQGTASPMIAIEPYIVDLIIQLSKMRSPVNVTTGLQLANSLIAGTSFEAELREWKIRHNIHSRMSAGVSGNDEAPAQQLLGQGYWRGFMRRNGHIVKSKRAVKFDYKRADWCTYANFLMMYREVYKEMVKGGIAVRLDDKVYMTKEGEAVEENDANRLGLATRFNVVRPDRLLFVDEVGSNTSQTKDGNVGGEKFLCEALQRPHTRAATKDSHFTVLGFTAATGIPLMCAIIFAAKELDANWVLGLDPTAEWIGNDDNLEENAGRGKRYPMGPTCVYNGVTVPSFCCCSENGSITAELLVAMLSTIDGLGVFDRSDGVPPFLLLDGHGSRFDLTFLEYINNPTTKWNVCIGVPYGTSYWQVGDSTEQNGCFKMALTRHKRNLLKKKEKRRAAFAIEKEDVVDLVARAWDDSFARINSNQKAIAERGWTPLNYNCLLHPEIVATSTRSSQQQKDVDEDDDNNCSTQQILESTTVSDVAVRPGDLNLCDGMAGTLVDSIVEVRMRDDARNGINQEESQLRRMQTARDVMNSKNRVTAGLLSASGNFNLGPEVLALLRAKRREQQEQQSEREEKKLRDYLALRDRVQAIRALNKEHAQLTVAQLRTMVLWFKTSNDSAVPTTRDLLLTRLQETNTRPEPQAPFPTVVGTQEQPSVTVVDEGGEEEIGV